LATKGGDFASATEKDTIFPTQSTPHSFFIASSLEIEIPNILKVEIESEEERKRG
jgi:hypothetical protein